VVVATVVVETAETPVHRQTAAKAVQLHELELSNRAIARALGTSDKTVAKAIAAVPLPGNG
jgi:hypothetical protein